MADTEAEDSSMASVDEDGITNILNQYKVDDRIENEYFSSYEDVEIHRLMISDHPRTSAYADAIKKNKHLFKGKVVMDVGAGTGILSLFMAAAGARKVYAVEASGMAAIIEKVACDNGFSDVIKVFPDKVENISLKENEKVDVLVSEWMGFYLLHESMLNSVITARDKFLSDNGTIFPSEARLYACPCSLQALYKEQINFWNNVYNFDMSAVKEVALKSKMKKPEVCLVPKSDLLAEPSCVKTFNLRWVTGEDVQSFTETSFVGITRAGLYQGLCLWFECDFDGREYDEEGKENGRLVTLSTSPSSPPTHWKQTVVVLGYGADMTSNQFDQSCQSEASNSEGSTPKQLESEERNCKPGPSQCRDSPSIGGKEKALGTKDKIQESGYQREELLVQKDYEVDEDEVVGWRLIFAQSKENIRHYTMTVEMLDPETEEHPIPCACPMPRCMIIAKMMESETEGDDAIDCT